MMGGNHSSKPASFYPPSDNDQFVTLLSYGLESHQFSFKKGFVLIALPVIELDG